jgi:hypothetical protein
MSARSHSRPGRTSSISSHVRYASDRYRNGKALKPTRRANRAHCWSFFKMADQSRHKSMDTLRGYVSDAEIFKDHAGIDLL